MPSSKRPARANTAVRRVAIYIRVSTLHQVDRDSLPMQRRDLIAYAQLILGIEDYQIFEDAGYSGKDTDRPAYQSMMDQVRQGVFSHILVWKIDRISRNLIDFAKMYEELQSLRVIFVSKNEQFDTSTAMGGAMLKIILVFAELERNMTAERVTATMISRAQQGIWNGGRVPFGYSYDPDSHEFSLLEEEADIVRLMFRRYLGCASLVETAKYLNLQGYRSRSGALWTPSTVWLILSNPWYAGAYRYNRYKGTKGRKANPAEEWVVVGDHHPAIVDNDALEKVAAVREENLRHPYTARSERGVNVFDGLVFCAKCGSEMRSRPERVHVDGLHSARHSCPGLRTGVCDNPSVSDLIIGEFVLNYILNMLNAKRGFSEIETPDALEKRLLSGSAFKNVASIDRGGLMELFDMLSGYSSDESFVFKLRKRSKMEVTSERAALLREKQSMEKALVRLQELYLYSERAISEKDYIVRRKEITDRLRELQRRLGVIRVDENSDTSDEEFVRIASHFLISDFLKNRQYASYTRLARDVSPDVLHEYMACVVDHLIVEDGRITSITFRNGITHRFAYFVSGR